MVIHIYVNATSLFNTLSKVASNKCNDHRQTKYIKLLHFIQTHSKHTKAKIKNVNRFGGEDHQNSTVQQLDLRVRLKSCVMRLKSCVSCVMRLKSCVMRIMRGGWHHLMIDHNAHSNPDKSLD